MSTQDDLVALFQKYLTLCQTPDADPSERTQMDQPMTYSISQHYHHSAHVVTENPHTLAASQSPHSDKHAIEILLQNHGVDFRTLHPSQVELFHTADPDQKRRLIELWQICPPDYNENSVESGDSASTATQAEEVRAVLRTDEQMSQKQLSSLTQDFDMESEEMNRFPLTTTSLCLPEYDAKWNHTPSAEPYMISGYELSAVTSAGNYTHSNTTMRGMPEYVHSIDPVYNKAINFGGKWKSWVTQRNQPLDYQSSAYEPHPIRMDGVLVSGIGGEDEEMY